MKKFILSICLVLSQIASAEVTEITDTKGRTIKVKLIKLEGSQLHFSKAGQSSRMSISLDKLSPASANKVRESMTKLQDEASKRPPLEIKTVIEKNNRRMGSSSYMRKMSIVAKVGLQNKNLNIEADKCHCTLLVIGEDQRDKNDFKVLGKREFTITPGHKMTEYKTEPVLTTYDSDNKGYGNIGGYKYDGYILIVRDADKKILATKTSVSRLKKDFDNSVAEKLLKVKENASLDRDMHPL